MKKTNKRAFTIVELVIVIAVIAILAAVLIPTFSSLVKKANMTSDKVAVDKMNTIIAAAEQIDSKPATLQELLKILSDVKIDATDYKALASGYKIVWDSGYNRVLYVNENDEVVYPVAYVAGSGVYGTSPGTRITLLGQFYTDDSWETKVSEEKIEKDYSINAQKLTNFKEAINTLKDNPDSVLEGEVKSAYEDYSGTYVSYYQNDVEANLIAMNFKNDSSIETGMMTFGTDSGSYTIAKVANPGQLVSYINYVNKDANSGKNFTLLILADIDLRGAEWIPMPLYAGNIDGCGKTITNLTMTDPTQVVKVYPGSYDYSTYLYYGFVSVFEGEYIGNLTFDKVDINCPGVEQDLSKIGSYMTGHTSSVLAGCVISRAGTETTIENINVKGGSVVGLSRTGGIIGCIGAKDVTINGELKENAAAGTVYIKKCVNGAAVSSLCSQKYRYGTVGGILSGTYRNTTNKDDDDTDYKDNKFKLYITECINTGNISGFTVAGILGSTISSIYGEQLMRFVKCENYGTITCFMPEVPNLGADYNCDSISAAGIANTYTTSKLVNCNADRIQFVDCINGAEIVAENNNTIDPSIKDKSYGIYLSGIAHNGDFSGCKNKGMFKVNIREKNIPSKINFKIGAISAEFSYYWGKTGESGFVSNKYDNCEGSVSIEFSNEEGYLNSNDPEKITIV